jgi:hypothetical protein
MKLEFLHALKGHNSYQKLQKRVICIQVGNVQMAYSLQIIFLNKINIF